MRLKLYTIPNCKEAVKIKEFLRRNNLQFEEAVVDNEDTKLELTRMEGYLQYAQESILKITFSHPIQLIYGFNEFSLNQLFEYVKKYLQRTE